MNRAALAGLVLLLALGFALRAPELRLRPLHNDEGVNAMKFRALYVDNNYKYNPDEFHGPTLPYFTLPAAWLQGGGDFNRFTEATYRSVTVAFGLGLILLLTLVAKDFGRAETFWSAVFIAVSPAMVFYSRYYIHEMLLIFFSMAAFGCAWRYAKSGRAAWLMGTGVGIGAMYATKETFVFALAAMAGAVVSARIWGHFTGPSSEAFPAKWNWRHIIGAAACALFTSVLFFTSFFTNSAGLADAVRTYLPWFRRAGGATEHAHSWFFYFERLAWFHAKGGPAWSEGFILLLAAVGFIGALRGKSALLRIIAFDTLYLTLVYTALPYKTPWCLLGFYHGMILLAGSGAALLWRSSGGIASRSALAVALSAGVSHLVWQDWRQNFAVDAHGIPYCDSAKTPYVYSQTLPDALKLVETVKALVAVSPEGTNTEIEVMSQESYWPLPWYFRGLQVGYWDEIPKAPLTPIVIAAANLKAAFDDRPGHSHLMAGYYELRPQVFLELYVNTNLWTAYVKTLPKDTE